MDKPNSAAADINKYLKEIREKIDSKELLASKPLEKDKKKFKSLVFDFLNVVYNEDKTLVKNIFECGECKKVMSVKRSNGTAPLRNHPCYKKFKAKQDAEVAAMQAAIEASQADSIRLEVGTNTLAKCFGTVSALSHEYGPIKTEDIKNLLPSTSSYDAW